MPLTRKQIVAAVLRQAAERAGEIEAADRAVEDDRKGGDAVRMRRLGPPPSHGFAAGPSLPRKQGRVVRRNSGSLPRRRGRVGVGATRGSEQHCRRIGCRGAGDALGARVERSEAGGEGVAERRQIGLRDDEGVGDRGLPRRLGKALERRRTRHRIDQRHHPAEAQALVEHRIGAEGEEDRAPDRRAR